VVNLRAALYINVSFVQFRRHGGEVLVGLGN